MIPPVEIVAYVQTMLPVIFRLFSFGNSISRYTCASVSKPLIESTECPKAMMTATTGIVGHHVPLNQPKPSSLNCRCAGVGGGGFWARPCVASVIRHQTRNITTMTVVTCMMRKAFVLDSCSPLMLYHQKYSVTPMPKNIANCSGDKRNENCSR